MSNDVYEEVSNKSYGGRLKESLKNILMGFGLVIGAFVLLFWNEGRSVQTYKTLKEGESLVVSVESAKIDSSMNNKLIHTTGKANTTTSITDPILGVSSTALILERTSEMYQWTERTEEKTEKELGGGERTVTRYYYEKKWSSSVHDSSTFKRSAGHENINHMPIKNAKFINDNITLGAFRLPKNLAEQISELTTLIPKNVDGVNNNFKQYASIEGDMIYITNGGTPSAPKIGDIRVSFKVALPQDVSILAVQKGDSFAKYLAKAGGTIYVLYQGLHSSEAMFKSEHEANVLLTWILRAVGFGMMFFGFTMIFKIFSVILDVIPILGNIAEFGIGIASFLLALILSLLTIAIAWLFYRPILSIVLFAVIGGIFYYVKIRKKKSVTNPKATQDQDDYTVANEQVTDYTK